MKSRTASPWASTFQRGNMTLSSPTPARTRMRSPAPWPRRCGIWSCRSSMMSLNCVSVTTCGAKLTPASPRVCLAAGITGRRTVYRPSRPRIGGRPNAEPPGAPLAATGRLLYDSDPLGMLPPAPGKIPHRRNPASPECAAANPWQYSRHTDRCRPRQGNAGAGTDLPMNQREASKMNPIRGEFLKIVQNIVRIVLVLALPAIFVWLAHSNGFNVLKSIDKMPIWAQLLTGAFFGGLIFTPAHNIGNSIWAIITLDMRRSLNAPEPNDKPYSQKALEFSAWERNMRRASIRQVSRKLLPRCAKIALVPTVIPLISLVLAIRQVAVEPSEQSFITLVAATIVLLLWYIGWVLVILIPAVLAIKLYYHK